MNMDSPRIRPAPKNAKALAHDGPEVLAGAKAIVSDPLIRRRLPAFFFVGPPRTATTWAWQILKDRTNLSREYKETAFFLQNFSRGFDWYLEHFEPLTCGPRIDIEPEYFASDVARRRISALIPEARIVCSFRDPVERLFSNYKILARSASVPASTFEEACLKDLRFVEAARYGTHLRAWLNAFGREHVLVLFYEDLLADPQAYADRICHFLGIDRFQLSPEQRSRVHSSDGFTQPHNRIWTEIGKNIGLRIWQFGSPRLNHVVRRMRLSRLFYDTGAPFELPDAAVAAKIRVRLRPEIELVEQLIGRPLTSWKDGPGTKPPGSVSKPDSHITPIDQ